MNRPAMYSRPNKPLRINVRKRAEFADIETIEAPDIVTVDKATECHVTPPEVAARMVEYLGPVGDFSTLEPSAGTGNLIKALLDSGHSPFELVAVERHNTLFNGLYKIDSMNGAGRINRCFLEWADEVRGKVQFPRVIMNPPFKRCKAHINAAISLLGRGGHTESPTLVALVPVTFDLEGAEVLERLPSDTFATARVHTKIIRYTKDA